MEQPDGVEEELENFDPLKAHFEDPEVNKFVDGIAEGLNALDLRDKSKLWVRYPRSINKNGLYNIMSSFGKVTRVFIANNNKFHKYSTAFVDYETFAEAERAIRGLNSGANAGLDIRVEISHARKKTPNDESEKEQSESEGEKQSNGNNNNDDTDDEETFKEAVINPIDFTKIFTPNEQREKVTQFEYQPLQPDPHTVLSLEDMKKKAQESNWIYSVDYERAEYDPDGAKSQFIQHLCGKCKLPATLCNEETKEYYCSLRCFEIPKEPESACQAPLKKGDKVSITAIISEKCIFVRRIEDDLDHLLEKVYRAAKVKLTPLEMTPNIGDDVLVKVYHGIFRAKVLEIIIDDRGTEIGVQLTDVGCTVDVTLENLFEMTPACLAFPSIVYKVHFDLNVPSINMNVIQYLVDLRDRKADLIVKSLDERDEKIYVELKDDEGNLVNEKITRLADLKKVDLTPSQFEELHSIPSPVGANQKLLVLYKEMLACSGDICCLNEKFLKDFYEMQKALNEYGSGLDPESYGSNTNDLCLAKVKDHWYRATILEKRGDELPTCCFMDLSETSQVSIKNIFPLPKVFAAYPMYSEFYAVENFMEASAKKKKLISSYINSQDFIIVDEVKDSKKGLLICFNALK